MCEGETAGGAAVQEEDLLRRFRDGDVSAFEAIARTHQDRVFRLAVALLGSREGARDATQEVFLRAYRGLPAWRFEARLGTWLYGVTVNVCREQRRTEARERRKQQRWRLLAAPLAPVSTPEPPDVAIRIEGLLDRLPPRQREVVALRVLHDLTVAETAAVLRVPEGTVKSNYFKAVASLRERLALDPAALEGGRP